MEKCNVSVGQLLTGIVRMVIMHPVHGVVHGQEKVEAFC